MKCGVLYVGGSSEVSKFAAQSILNVFDSEHPLSFLFKGTTKLGIALSSACVDLA